VDDVKRTFRKCTALLQTKLLCRLEVWVLVDKLVNWLLHGWLTVTMGSTPLAEKSRKAAAHATKEINHTILEHSSSHTEGVVCLELPDPSFRDRSGPESVSKSTNAAPAKLRG
jgi:hypothetical protein